VWGIPAVAARAIRRLCFIADPFVGASLDGNRAIVGWHLAHLEANLSELDTTVAGPMPRRDHLLVNVA